MFILGNNVGRHYNTALYKFPSHDCKEFKTDLMCTTSFSPTLGEVISSYNSGYNKEEGLMGVLK